MTKNNHIGWNMLVSELVVTTGNKRPGDRSKVSADPGAWAGNIRSGDR